MGNEFSAFAYFADLLVVTFFIVPIYYALKAPTARRALLTATGAFLLFAIAPRLAVFYILFWISAWLGHRWLAAQNAPPQPGAIFFVLVAVFLAPMVTWKLVTEPFTIQFNLILHSWVGLFSPWLEQLDAVRDILAPIGLSFATFRAVDLLIQTHVGLIGRLSFERVLFYGLFPPVQVIGPIIEYSEVEAASSRAAPIQLEDLITGIQQIFIGLFKVFALAYPLERSAELFLYYDSNPVPALWIALTGFTFYFYLNFSGYSDIAIGISRLFGFHLKANFNWPYWRPNPQEFWANWHMGLTRFARRNIFIPFGGYRKGNQYPAIIMTIMVIALWHDLSLSLVLFGTYHAAGLCAHRFWDDRNRRLSTQAKDNAVTLISKRIGTFGFVMLSFPMIMLPTASLPDFYGALFGL